MVQKKSVAKSTPKSVPAAAPVEVVPVAEIPVAEKPSSTPVVEDVVTLDKYAEVIDWVQTSLTKHKEILVILKALQKDHVKLVKQTVKKVKKTTVDGASKRSPSGFAKPAQLSDELCKFLGVELGTLMARTIVTRHINEYIKKNNLQDPVDKRQIVPDEKLKAILSTIPSDKQLTYFNLQTFIKQHFTKGVAV